MHFGILMMSIVTLGGMTPADGVAMFAVCALMDVMIEEYSIESIPFIAAIVGLIFLLLLLPGVVLWLPNSRSARDPGQPDAGKAAVCRSGQGPRRHRNGSSSWSHGWSAAGGRSEAAGVGDAPDVAPVQPEVVQPPLRHGREFPDRAANPHLGGDGMI